MAGTVAPYNMTDVSLCEDATGWTAVGGTLSVADNTIFSPKQGTYNLQNYSASAVARGADFTYGSNQILTSKTVYVWFATSKVPAIPAKGANGMRIRLEDVSGYWAEWDIFGNTELPHGGWICWAINPGTNCSNASRNGGTVPVLTTIRKIGWRCGTAGTTVGSKTYIYFDAVRFGDGLQISAGTSGSPATFEDFVTSENTNAYGVVNKYKGVYFIQGKLIIGTASGATYFKDASKSIVIQDAFVPASTFSITSLGNSGADTEIYLGTSPGIQGCVFQRESTTQTASYSIDLSYATRTKIGLYGNTFKGAGVITLPTYNADYLREVKKCNFESCDEFIANSCPVSVCNFISTSSTIAALKWNESINISNCSFISNVTGSGIEMPSAAGTPYGYNALFFSGNTGYDVNNTSGSAITINKNLLSDPTTSMGSAVTFAGTSVTTSIVVSDIDTGAKIAGARVLVLVADGSNFPYLATVSIIGSETTAIVTHTAHGLATNDNVKISGCTQSIYNGVFTITKDDVNTYHYTTPATITISPATGLPKATLALINKDSAAVTGLASDTRSMPNDQLITGWVRLATGSYYKQSPISDTVDKNYGKSINVQLIPDV